jgi:predicted enzyme related to lactoylglutathione lyase
MSLIEGVGGAFLFSENPVRLAGWYRDVLEIPFGDEPPFYVQYFARAEDDSERRVDTSFAILTSKHSVPKLPANDDATDMYGDQPFMVNLRVRDLPSVTERIKKKGVEVLHELDEGYARFAWIRDADGNRVELYEPRHGDIG